MPEASYWKRILRNLGFLGSIIGGISAVSLICSGFKLGWAEPLKKILEQYFVIIENFRRVVEPYLMPVFKALADALDFQVTFGPHWTDVLLIMMIYLGSRVKSYASAGKYIRTFLMLIVSTAIGIISSFFVAIDNQTFWQSAFLSSSVPLIGFFAYDVIYSAVGATFDRQGAVTWFGEFNRHLKFSLPLLVIAAIANFLLARAFVSFFAMSVYQAFVLIFLFDYIVISGYWAYKSFQYASNREHRKLGESVQQRFRRSTATTVSLNVAIVIASALMFTVFNAGLIAAGVPFSELCQ